MLLKLLLALILPGILVILFTRVTYNHYVGLLLSIALIIASVYKGYTDSIYIIFVDIISLVAGFLYARNMGKRAKK
ncbi:CsbA family protein [Ferdinandcohnia sp. Marseille-Q9671]